MIKLIFIAQIEQKVNYLIIHRTAIDPFFVNVKIRVYENHHKAINFNN